MYVFSDSFSKTETSVAAEIHQQVHKGRKQNPYPRIFLTVVATFGPLRNLRFLI